MTQNHQAKVERLAAEVKKFYQQKRPFYIYHGSTNSTRYLTFDRHSTVDISHFNEVLSVDTKKKLALVEPNVPMDKLVAATLKHGLLPPVVTELPGITVGGGIQGVAGESSSYRWGTLSDTCVSIETVLASGEVVTTSRTQNKDLFYGMAGAFGTLGIITSAEIQLVPAKKYVRLEYVPVKSFKAANDLLLKESELARYDYIDGIMFSKTKGVIMLGQLTDKKVGKVARFTRAHDDWFYLHVERVNNRAERHSETIPIVDYLFRYDRGAFWVGRYPYERAGLPFNRFTRWLADPLIHARKMFQALHESGAGQLYVIQDLLLPPGNTVKFMNYIDKTFHTYPLWLCPLKIVKDWTKGGDQQKFVIDIGVWDNHAFTNYVEFLQSNRDLEDTLHKLGGQKWLYSQTYYSEDEFWQIYDKPRYQKLREKYHAETLPDMYDKVRVKGRKPVRIKSASFKTLFGLAKLRIGG